MLISRITVTSFLAAAMGVYACVLLSDVTARAQQADQAQGEQRATFNRRPLTDFLSGTFFLHKNGEIDLTGDVEFVIEADRDSDGALSNVRVTQKAGDAKLMRVAEDLATALSDSRFFNWVEEARHLRLDISSGEANVGVRLSYEAESAAAARRTTSAYGTMFHLGALAKQGQPEGLIYKSLTISSKDREVMANFSMPRETFCALLSKYLSGN